MLNVEGFQTFWQTMQLDYSMSNHQILPEVWGSWIYVLNYSLSDKVFCLLTQWFWRENATGCMMLAIIMSKKC